MNRRKAPYDKYRERFGVLIRPSGRMEIVQLGFDGGSEELLDALEKYFGGALKAKDYDYVEGEIRTLKGICGSRVLKVIIETCLLTDDEKIKMCELVTSAGADFIKTSTGFSTAGATLEDVKLFAEHVGPGVRIKAAGGISSFDDAEAFIKLGASRLGTSRLVKIEKAG